MRILVCIKQLADPESKPVISADGRWAEYDGRTAWRINRFDEHAIEEALQIKETIPGTEVDILSVGPERVKTAVRRGIEMGADRGIHIYLEDSGYTSPSVKAHLIADYCSCMRYDLILTGVMSEDMMSGQTGPMLAALLGCPSASGVMKLVPDAENMKVHVVRELDGLSTASMDMMLPALVTVQSGINRPRYPSLSNVMRAKTAVITEIRSCAGITAQKYETAEAVLDARPERSGKILQGTPADKAEELWQILHKKSLI